MITDFFLFLIFIFGASVGSFLNVLIDRLPKGEKITGRSRCDYCRRQLAWYDLIPIISFFLLKGRCRYCGKKISLQYPLVEILTGILYVLVFIFQFFPLSGIPLRGTVFNEFSVFSFQFFKLIGFWGIISCLIVIFFSDLKYHLISDWILLSLFVFSVILNTVKYLSTCLSQSPINCVILRLVQNNIFSGLIVAFPIFLIYYISHERAMGLGDVYLSAIIGFLMDWKAGFIALYIAFVAGAMFGLGMIILHKKKLKSKIAFGPFLVGGTTVMLFWGEKIFDIIKKIYGL